jgi:hypothetical protein
MSPGEPSRLPADAIERWWLIFTPPRSPGWWRIMLTEEFGHVYAIRQPLSGILIFLDPLIHRVENAIVLERASDVISRALADGHRVLVYTKHTRAYDAHTDVRVGRGLCITCASFLAYVLGINFSWRCTPKQLYRAALRAGAEELHGRDLQPPKAQEGQEAREDARGAAGQREEERRAG